MRFPCRTALRVRSKQADQDLRHDPAADRTEPVATTSVLGRP